MVNDGGAGGERRCARTRWPDETGKIDVLLASATDLNDFFVDLAHIDGRMVITRHDVCPSAATKVLVLREIGCGNVAKFVQNPCSLLGVVAAHGEVARDLWRDGEPVGPFAGGRLVLAVLLDLEHLFVAEEQLGGLINESSSRETVWSPSKVPVVE